MQARKPGGKGRRGSFMSLQRRSSWRPLPSDFLRGGPTRLERERWAVGGHRRIGWHCNAKFWEEEKKMRAYSKRGKKK